MNKKKVSSETNKTKTFAPSPNQHKKGVTLQELLIVIGILAVLATVAVYSMSRYLPSWKVRGAASQIVQAMRRAQQLAVTNQLYYKVLFDPNNCCYYIIRINADSSETVLEHTYLPSGVCIDGGSSDLKVCWADGHQIGTWQKIILDYKAFAAGGGGTATPTPTATQAAPTSTPTPTGCHEAICMTPTPTPPVPTPTPIVVPSGKCVIFSPSGGADGTGNIVVIGGNQGSNQVIVINVAANGKIATLPVAIVTGTFVPNYTPLPQGTTTPSVTPTPPKG